MLRENNLTIKIAEPEKVILDYFYLNRLNDFDEIDEMRFNEIVAKEIINSDKLRTYQQVFNSKILDKRIQIFIQIINA